MSFQHDELTLRLSQHRRVARVVVVASKGSAPREVGASMLVWNGGQSGTIGGGALEFQAAKQALSGPSIETVALGPARGQCCGGRVTLATEVFDETPLVDRFFTRQIKGLNKKPLSISRQEANLRRGEKTRLVFENGWLFEPIDPIKTPLWIYGAGHVGRALVHTISALPDFNITWVDTTPDRFPDTIPENVTQVVAPQPRLIEHAPLNAWHLILTYSHEIDLDICHRLLTHGFASAGLIGSKTKWARFRTRLSQLGHSNEQISRIECPIGDPNLGKHPQEIAVGVASSLLSRRHTVSVGENLAI